MVVAMPDFVIAELRSKVQEHVGSHEQSSNAMIMDFH